MWRRLRQLRKWCMSVSDVTAAQVNALLGVKDSYKAPDALMAILFDKPRREQLFKDLLELFRYDVTYDWFHVYFQEEHAERNTKKQDFTPPAVADLLARMIGTDSPESGGTRYEPCAGTGGMVIAKWDEDRCQHTPWNYQPSWYLYQCEELSDRALPFLLANLMIRGMNASVVHGDVLTREAHGVFFIQNENDDHLQFSSLNVFPYSPATKRFFSIKEFVGEQYPPHIESVTWPAHLGAYEPKTEVIDI